MVVQEGEYHTTYTCITINTTTDDGSSMYIVCVCVKTITTTEVREKTAAINLPVDVCYDAADIIPSVLFVSNLVDLMIFSLSNSHSTLTSVMGSTWLCICLIMGGSRVLSGSSTSSRFTTFGFSLQIIYDGLMLIMESLVHS